MEVFRIASVRSNITRSLATGNVQSVAMTWRMAGGAVAAPHAPQAPRDDEAIASAVV